MKYDDFIKMLEENDHLFDYKGGKDIGVTVKNKELKTETKFELEAIEKNDWEVLKKATHHGKNIEHITRVTGFFSKTASWNKGKIAELKDRDRVTI